MPTSLLEQNLRRVRERIERAAREAGRNPQGVHLLPVTKSVPGSIALALARLGERELAENRLEGLEPKAELFEREGEPVRWHFIGHIQRNKARRVLRHAAVIHSVDTLRLVDALERIAAEDGRAPEVYLEVKLSREEAKHGFAPGELDEAVRSAGACGHLALLGLMAMAPLEIEEAGDATLDAAARAVFDELGRLARRLEGDPALARCFRGGRVQLSMGMSGDFEAAIAAGSDLVRVGSALFEGVAAASEAER